MELFFKFATLFGIPIATYFTYKKWISSKNKKRLIYLCNIKFPDQYEPMLEKFIPYKFLTEEEKKRFQAKFLFFMEDKTFNGVGELVVSDEMKFLIASEACLMITNLSGGIYPGLKNIYLMEDVFIPKDNPVNIQTGLPTHSARLGEAWKAGPIVLSWNSISQGSSVVFHEFSHQLDQQDGDFDGTPRLGKGGNYDLWAHIMGSEFSKLRQDIARNHRSDIDRYGATNEAEFFAVITEHFFVRPRNLQEGHPELFKLIQSYFKLNPKLWTTR